MNKTTVSKMIFGAVLLLFTACTQDELAEQGTALPDGEYPLQIGSVSITAEASEEPWTRVTEKPDGSGSVFQDEDRIGVRIAGSEETGIYRIKVDDAGNVTITPDKPVYWKSTQPAEVTAWYPAEASRVSFGSQHMDGLTYVLRGTGTGNHQSPVSLGFTHSLAKVRVKLKGERASQVTNVEVYGFTSCTNTQGTLATDADSQGWITTKSCIYNGESCWEANLVPGEIGDQTTQPFVRLNETTVVPVSTLTTLEAGNVHTITITANSEGMQTIDLSNEDCIINDDGTYYFSGTGNHAIRVTGGKPNIYLEDAQISVLGGNAIDITGGDPTIHVKGNDNEVSSNNGAGIYVAGSSTVTITGNSRDDALTTRGGNGGSGIGGNHATCGNIEISNMTVHAHGSDENADFLSAGIGGSGNNGCGTITIDNATISAYGASDGAAGNMSSPGIGGGLYGDDKGTYSTITIKNNSQVSVQRGSNRSDYIGSGGSTNNPANSPNGIDATVDETSTITPLN
ncbi:fimbrillin family protein [uncultured Bacteroides sp.]|uniref:fimbrillin family protein n=1 Tax=uncultured Bacteroides sp. TaxID=162156 RepID=UPI002597A19D|nr:fimbrillin family protein [uncultured Bacteroides sp.]